MKYGKGDILALKSPLSVHSKQDDCNCDGVEYVVVIEVDEEFRNPYRVVPEKKCSRHSGEPVDFLDSDGHILRIADVGIADRVGVDYQYSEMKTDLDTFWNNLIRR